MRLTSPSFTLFVVFAWFFGLSSASHAAEGVEEFTTKAAKVIKKTKATIKKTKEDGLKNGLKEHQAAAIGLQAGLKEYEAAVIALRAEFPDNPKPWAMLLEVAINLDYQDEKLSVLLLN